MIPCLFPFPELLVTGCIPGRPASASTHCETLVSTQLMQGLHRAEKLAKRVLTADTLLCKMPQKQFVSKDNPEACRTDTVTRLTDEFKTAGKSRV
jgi:hypothetical protein